MMPIEIFETNPSSVIIRKILSELSEKAVFAENNLLKERTVWIVPVSLRDDIAKLSGVIEDRGKKHRAVELARIMKGNSSKVPIIEAEYSSDGKLRQSVQRFLQKTTGGSQKLFIIAVSDVIFESLRKTAVEPPVLTDFPLTFNGRTKAVLDLMGHSKVSDELNKAFIGNSPAVEAVRQFIMRAAYANDTAVLITGDTGTGKEIVARQIHLNSKRGPYQFVAVNCGAFAENLLESELFGYTKGAFTGASENRQGLWELADGGTLFLDEIAELTPSHQAKLLRALQEKSIRPVGGKNEIAVKARIISATNRDLRGMVQTGQFREDLYYRLRDFLIITPALREHPEDIGLLACAFWKRLTRNKDAILPEGIIKALREHNWPGNVREMRMVLSHLFGLFPNVQFLDERHLQAVFGMQGYSIPSGSKETATASKPRSGGFTFIHQLRRVYETIRAVEHIILPLLNQDSQNPQQSPQISTSIANLLNEIDLHSRTPRNFSPRTFDHINLLRSRLAYFLSEYENDPRNAIGYLQDDTRRVIEDAIADILSEIDQAFPTEN